MINQVVTFKEWLPDQPDLGNPGLIEATNVLPLSDGYAPFRPLDGSGGTAAGSTAGVFYGAFVATGTTKFDHKIHYNTGFYYRAEASTFSSIVASDTAIFTQYQNILFAAGGSHRLAKATMGAITAGGAGGLSEITAAPYCDVVGVVGQFVVVGGLYDETITTPPLSANRQNYIQWSAIDDPVNWPTPGSATAIASQAGAQALLEQYGPVMAVHGGDQFAIVLQSRAVTRMTYIGGSAVFQFDMIDNSRGADGYHSSARVGDMTYFISNDGFYRTNGVGVEPIGDGIVDATWAAITASSAITCAYDPANDLVCWGNGSHIFYFNPKNRRWSMCQQAHKFLVTNGYLGYLMGWDGNFVRGYTLATAGSAVITTGEVEMKPGGYSRVSGFKPLVSGSTAVSMTVAIGTRNSQDTAASFTSETTANSRTGFADFRSEARYHRARLTITGNFERAIGGEYLAAPSGHV